MGEKGREAQDAIKELIKRGKGQYECFAIDGGRLGLRSVLLKARSKGKKTSVVAEQEAMKAAVGPEEWEGIEQEAAR